MANTARTFNLGLTGEWQLIELPNRLRRLELKNIEGSPIEIKFNIEDPPFYINSDTTYDTGWCPDVFDSVSVYVRGQGNIDGIFWR